LLLEIFTRTGIGTEIVDPENAVQSSPTGRRPVMARP
jgi:hypothetical protein